MDDVDTIPLDHAVLQEAEAIIPRIRTLDAIHLASALRSGLEDLVIVTHDIKVANYLCQHCVVLEQGRVVDRIAMDNPQPQSLLGRFFFETAKGWTDQTVLPQEQT